MSFDHLAPYYRTMEFVLAGDILQRCRTAFLAEVMLCRRALVLGEGPGRFVPELLRVNPEVKVTCVEQSPRMITEARKRIGEAAAPRVRFEAADALVWQPGESFDLVATHYFLDCFPPEQLRGLIEKIAASLTLEARWLLADFCEPAQGWQRWRAKAVLALMYRFFRLTTGLAAVRLTPPDRFLVERGFQLVGRRLASFGLVHSDYWQRSA